MNAGCIFYTSYRSLNLLPVLYKWKQIFFIKFCGDRDLGWKPKQANIVSEILRQRDIWRHGKYESIHYVSCRSTTYYGIFASDYLHGAIINHAKAISLDFWLHLSIKS